MARHPSDRLLKVAANVLDMELSLAVKATASGRVGTVCTGTAVKTLTLGDVTLDLPMTVVASCIHSSELVILVSVGQDDTSLSMALVVSRTSAASWLKSQLFLFDTRDSRYSDVLMTIHAEKPVIGKAAKLYPMSVRAAQWDTTTQRWKDMVP